MALTDIIQRIHRDAEDEAAQIRAAAQARAAEMRAAAEASAEEERVSALTRVEADADREASRLVVTARLAARDEALSSRRQLLSEALQATGQRIAELPDDEYARFLGGRIAAAVRGGETVSLGTADAGRAQAVMAEVARLSPGRDVSLSPTPAPFDRGALVAGARTRVDLSIPAIVDERRSEIEAAAASVLFGEEA